MEYPTDNAKRHDEFARLYGIIKRLRAPDGCPWDLEQTALTLRKDLVEEVYEAIDAINRKDEPNLKEELGDIFLILMMITRIKEQENQFNLEEVLSGISEKLIRRHPHVFGEIEVSGVDEVLKNWDVIKIDEKGKPDSILSGIPAGLPPLERACKISKKAVKAGFEWNHVDEIWDKLKEEIDELKAEYAKQDQVKMEQEMGDILFTIVNVARKMKIDPSLALDQTNNKFTRRFQKMEEMLKDAGLDIHQTDIQTLDRFWDQIKMSERENTI